MKRKCNILVFIGCRSDEGLSAPIIKRLRDDPFFKCFIKRLNPADFLDSFYLVDDGIDIFNHIDPILDLALIVGDRVEMMAATQACFLNHIPIAHLYAGIKTNFSTFDGIHRHCISLMADILLCEDDASYITALNLCDIIGKEDVLISKVGFTHLDDIDEGDLDLFKIPQEEYDLVLINDTTLQKEGDIDLEQVGDSLPELFIVIDSNPDKGYKQIVSVPVGQKVKHYDNLPRIQFLSLLKYCRYFITNSSSAYYEAPYFLQPEQIKLVGKRNKTRSTTFTKLEKGGSERVIQVIKEWWRRKCKDE